LLLPRRLLLVRPRGAFNLGIRSQHLRRLVLASEYTTSVGYGLSDRRPWNRTGAVPLILVVAAIALSVGVLALFNALIPRLYLYESARAGLPRSYSARGD
jgi:hypothetical protein